MTTKYGGMPMAVWGSIPARESTVRRFCRKLLGDWLKSVPHDSLLHLHLLHCLFYVILFSEAHDICSISLFAVFSLDIMSVFIPTCNSLGIYPFYFFYFFKWGGSSLFFFLIGLDPMTESLLFLYCFPNSNKHIHLFPLTDISCFLPPKKHKEQSLLFAVALIECDAHSPNLTPHSLPLLWLTS